MAITTINGRKYFIDVDSIEIKKISAGKFEVKFDDYHTFTVIGGRESGGAANEWFCHCPRLYGEKWLVTDSMVKAVKMGAMY